MCQKHIYIHTYIKIHIQIHIYVQVHVCVCICTYKDMNKVCFLLWVMVRKVLIPLIYRNPLPLL